MYNNLNNIEKHEGDQEQTPVLSLDTPDTQLIRNFRRWVNDAKGFWDKRSGFNLKEKRQKNVEYYLGKQIDKSRLYAHQVPYIDNQIYVGAQSILAYVSGNTPAADVIPENDEVQTVVMAEDLESMVNTHSEKHHLSEKIKSVSYDLLNKYIGVLKLEYDEKTKDVVPRVVAPENIIVDHLAKLGEEPRFIAEVKSDTIAQLMKKFPGSRERIMKYYDFERMTSKRENTTVSYYEIWFTDDTQPAGKDECVAWFFGDVMLDKSRNPNYLYKEEGLSVKNAIDYPHKPYVFFNYLNDGQHLIDHTSPVEQAIPLQDILNKRGRQIIENADTANSVLVFKAGAIDAEDASNITRDPNQSVLLSVDNDMPVNSAYGEITPHLLPNYVVNDYQNTKNAIHNVLGTPSQFRGDDSKRDVGTLGEAKMIQGQASGRQDEIVRSLETGLDRYFRLLVQMMKVYYKDPHKVATRDNDGKFKYIELSRSTMPDIAEISISKGSLIRVDHDRKENVSMSLAKMGLIDPYNLFKDLRLKDAAGRYESLVKFKVDPTSLVEEVKSEVQDRDAYVDFTVIMTGDKAVQRKNIEPKYIQSMRELLATDQFLYAPKDRQQALLSFIEQAVIGLYNRTKLDAAAENGQLIDPSTPITPEPPELDQPPQPLGASQMMPPQAPPVQDAGPDIPDAGAAPAPVLSNMNLPPIQ